MMETAQGKVQIQGTIEMRDKDGNIVKVVPFSGAVPVEQAPEQPEDKPAADQDQQQKDE